MTNAVTTVIVDLQCVLVSGVQQRDSVMYMFFFVFFSIMVYYKILNIGPRVIQQDLIVCLFPNSQFIPPPPLFSPLVTIHLFHIPVSPFVFYL